MGTMVNRKSPDGTISAASTVLGGAEPLSDEDRKKLNEELRTERRERALDFVLMGAVVDKDFGHTLCEKVGAFFRDDKALATVLKKAATGGRSGRPTTWHSGRYQMLLLHYAHAISEETKGDHDSTLQLLVEFEKRMTGNVLSTRFIDNKITEGIKALKEAGQLDEVLGVADWVRDAIEKRIARGDASKKQKPRAPRTKGRSPKRQN